MTYSRFDAGTNLELLLRVLELDVVVVNRPNDTVDVSRDRDEQSSLSQSFDSSLSYSSVSEPIGGRENHFDDFSNFDVADSQEGLLEDRRLERELYESVES